MVTCTLQWVHMYSTTRLQRSRSSCRERAEIKASLLHGLCEIVLWLALLSRDTNCWTRKCSPVSVPTTQTSSAVLFVFCPGTGIEKLKRRLFRGVRSFILNRAWTRAVYCKWVVCMFLYLRTSTSSHVETNLCRFTISSRTTILTCCLWLKPDFSIKVTTRFSVPHVPQVHCSEPRCLQARRAKNSDSNWRLWRKRDGSGFR